MRILFVSMSSLADPSSGAAISVRTILRQLAARGHQVMSFSAGCFDRALREAPTDMLKWSRYQKIPEKPAWIFRDGSVTHIAFPGRSTRVTERMSEDLSELISGGKDIAAEFKPDVVITYGSSPLEKQLRSHARRLGARIVFYLANPNYKNRHVFDGVDLVLTDTQATADLYHERLKLNCVAIGKFVDPLDARRPAKTNRHVTFVNPSFPKGATLFYRIAEMMAQTLPSVRFMVVESRSNLREIENGTGIPFSSMRNIRKVGLQTDLSDVFSRSHILLVPSLWHESGGRVAVEALSLGIPIISSDHGGLPEVVGDGGIRIPVPQPLREDNRLIPPPSVAVPWVSAIARLWTDDEFWSERNTAALKQWKTLDPQPRLLQVESLLQGIVDD